MRMYDVIEKKKHGEELTKEEIDFVVQGYTSGAIPDYQMSALLMAIYFNKMSIRETSDLTMAMAYSGETSDLSQISGVKVDKHSTGGVGDTTTIVLAPLVAAAGVPVAKMSGRGLGHTGGTIDKLEAFPGFSVALSTQDFIKNVNTHHIAVVSQTGNLAPADKKIYALRDVTATVDNISLIAASIMSKKIASGADAIVLDVKCGSGAFMKTLEDAVALGEAMVNIGKHVGRKTMAIITDMNQPLSYAVGNTLEVVEAIETLKGHGPKELTTLSKTLAAYMLVLAGRVTTPEEGMDLTDQLITSGAAIDKLKEWVTIQGGNPTSVMDYSLMPGTTYTQEVYAQYTGYVSGIDTELIGKAALLVGAGRENKESTIDLGAGLIIHKKIGEKVVVGESIATLYYNEGKNPEDAAIRVQQAYHISDSPVETPTLIHKIIY